MAPELQEALLTARCPAQPASPGQPLPMGQFGNFAVLRAPATTVGTNYGDIHPAPSHRGLFQEGEGRGDTPGQADHGLPFTSPSCRSPRDQQRKNGLG